MESISASVCSATLGALPPGVFITRTPRRVAASRSILSTPTPARPTTRRLRRVAQQLVGDARGAAHDERIRVRHLGGERRGGGLHDLPAGVGQEFYTVFTDAIRNDNFHGPKRLAATIGSVN